MNSQDITVIITSFHSGNKIFDCIKSINKDVKIILIENSNDHLLKKEIQSRFSNVECILSEENLGYGAGNNLGLSMVKTDYALIINPDVTLKNDAMDKFFLSINKVESFGIIAPVSKNEKYSNFNIDLDKDIKEVQNVKGFAMFLNMKNFKEIGFFDENFFFYFEEIDLCKRLTDCGKKIYLVPEIKIEHEGGVSHEKSIMIEMELSRNWHWMWSTFNYHRKYKGFFISFIIVLPKLSSAIVKVLLYSLIFNKAKRKIYYQRLSGLINAMLGKNSWYRPKV